MPLDSSAGARDNESINAIRFVAALLVLVGHVRLILFEDFAASDQSAVTAVAYSMTSLGNPAVLVFFALSGYWVGGALTRRVRNGRDLALRSYAINRLTRLWLVVVPAVALTLAVDAVGKALFASADVYSRPETYTGIDADPSHSVSTVLGNLFFVQEIHVLPLGYNHPLWSLSYEFWYYLLFPALMLAVLPRVRGVARLGAIVVAAAAAAIVGSDVLALFPAWLIGAAAGATRDEAQRWADRHTEMVVAGARLSAVAATVLGMLALRFVAVPPFVAGLLVGVPTAVLLWLLVGDWRPAGPAGDLLRGCSRLAHSSFSLYAIHMPVVVFIGAWAIPDRGDRLSLVGPSAVFLLLIVVLLVVIAELFARFTEQRTEIVRTVLLRRLGQRAGRSV